MNGKTKEDIKKMIYEVKGKKVMLASDLAKLYQCKNGTKEVNQAVKNNTEKFIKSMTWTLNDYEVSCFLVKNFDQKKETRGGRYKRPRVFTIDGIKVLATIFKSEKVKEITRLILEIFEEEKNDLNMQNNLYLREENIKSMIYNIRGKRVILDEDIAKLFQYETKMLNRQVLRNIERFPENYCFQLTEEEYNTNLRCHFGTSSYGGRRYLPYAFTEYGVIMLTSILKSKVAIEASLRITNTFIEMRKIISEELLEEKYYKNLIIQNTEDIKKINETLRNLSAMDFKEKIFFDGEIYDAYSKIVDILQLAKKELMVIDGYADKSFLDMIRDINLPVTLITKIKPLLKNSDIENYQKQYNNLSIIYNDSFHDRFIIIDKKQIYHLGTSLNHVGNKVFAINKLEEPEMIKGLLNKINNIKHTL